MCNFRRLTWISLGLDFIGIRNLLLLATRLLSVIVFLQIWRLHQINRFALLRLSICSVLNLKSISRRDCVSIQNKSRNNTFEAVESLKKLMHAPNMRLLLWNWYKNCRQSRILSVHFWFGRNLWKIPREYQKCSVTHLFIAISFFYFRYFYFYFVSRSASEVICSASCKYHMDQWSHGLCFMGRYENMNAFAENGECIVRLHCNVYGILRILIFP